MIVSRGSVYGYPIAISYIILRKNIYVLYLFFSDTFFQKGTKFTLQSGKSILTELWNKVS